MKLQLYILISLLFISLGLTAQDNPPKKENEGNVKVYQDDAIKNLIGSGRASTQPKTADSSAVGASSVSKEGSFSSVDSKRGSYRILVFAGNNQKESKQEAMRKRNLVKSRYPSMGVDVQYDSPMWKVCAGRYPSKADAENALHLLRGSFPSFGKEMYVIRVAYK